MLVAAFELAVAFELAFACVLAFVAYGADCDPNDLTLEFEVEVAAAVLAVASNNIACLDS